MPIREEEVCIEISRRVRVTSQHLVLAKAFLLNLNRTQQYQPRQLAMQFVTQQGHTIPNPIVLHPSTDIQMAIIGTSNYLMSRLAVAEAIWSFIHGGVFIHNGHFIDITCHVEWTTGVSGSGGQSGSWDFNEFDIQVPHGVVFAPSHRVETNEVLVNHDLFILQAGIESADEEVVDALKDAIKCFQRELYRPTVVLLGKAMEGAWIELGVALADSIHDNPQVNKLKEMMISEAPLVKKIGEVVKLYKRRDLIGHIIEQSGVRPGELDDIIIWSEVLRDARNAIHFGVKPLISNDYEKVAVLLLAAATNLSKLYAIKRAAQV